MSNIFAKSMQHTDWSLIKWADYNTSK